MKKIFLFTFILSLALFGCEPGAAETRLNVELGDFSITPNQFTVRAGSVISVSVINNGTIEHDFNIIKMGADIGDMFDPEDEANVLWEVKVKPGETITGTFTVPEETGSYQVICSMPGHLQAGMSGTIIVVR
jgi:uncharacterized cupredoxin-like copper-binding protein